MNIFTEPVFDETIVNAHWHSYSPFLNSFGPSDIIRIQIQNQNLNILPSTSIIYIEGFLVDKDNKASTVSKLVNNAVSFLFDEIRYELNGKEIDNNRNVGITSTLKNYISLNQNESASLFNSSWSPDKSINATAAFFNFCIPLKRLLGFAEDYKNIIPNAKHELILTRSRTNDNSIISTNAVVDKPKITILKVCWKVQHIDLADHSKLNLYKSIENGNIMKIPFRNWELHEYPTLPSGTVHHIWNVKTTSQLEKPRFIIFTLQTDKQNQLDKDPSNFDYCDVTDLKVYLNSEAYPYEDMNLDFSKDRYAIAYDMYINFRHFYYNNSISESLISWNNFKNKAPIFIIDTRYQNDNLKLGAVDVRIEIKASKPIPDKTTAYCLMLHDRLVEYKPLTGEVNKIV